MVTFPYGTVLKIQREFSLHDIKARMERIKGLGMNIIVVWPGVFWWEDRTRSGYPFNTGTEILKYAETLGLEILMELAGQITALEYAPDFAMKQEYLAVNENGTYKNNVRNYDYINYFHPEVKQLIKENFQAAAAAYKDFPALYGYDIWNETMWKSYDRYTILAFRKWLKNKYRTLENLNDSWDRAYHDWSQIEYTSWTWASTMPLVDFSIFSREAIGMFLSEWKAYIREADPIHPVLADNVGTAVRNNGWIRSHDDEILAKSVDRTGLSFYVKHNEKSTYTDWERCQLLESSAFTSPDRRFWVAEMQSHHRALFNPFGTVSAEDIRMWNWEALSHGANGIVYWKWEPFIKGHQTFGRGLVNHNGKFMPRALEAQKVNSLIQENAEEFAECTPEIPETAILFDPENMDIIREYVYPNTSVVSETIYNDGIKGLYQSLWEENIPATFILPGHLNSENTKNIKTIFTSNQIKITGELAEQLKTFVKNGGTLINDGLFGFVNDRAVLHGDLPGGPLSDIIGLDLEDVACNDLTFSLSTESGQIKFEGFFERLITAVTGDDTQTVSAFPNGDPAVTESRYGNGRIIHILTMFWYGVYKAAASQGRELIRYIDSRFSLSRHSCSSSQVHYRMLQGRKRSILILRNYSRERVHCEFIPSPGYREDTQIRDLHTGDRTLLKRGNPLQTEIEGRDVKVFMMEASEDST